MINEQLYKLYASRTQGINALYADLDAKDIKDYAGPLLPYCWEQKYLESKYRLVISLMCLIVPIRRTID